MTHWSSIICTQWSRRHEWLRRNTGGTRMAYHVVCPVCGVPNTKCVAAFVGGDDHKRWVRVRKDDTCVCRLTPVQEAAVLRIAKVEALLGGPPSP